MGFFTLEIAHKVAPTGRVIAMDVQPKIIEQLKRRAAKANLAERIDAHIARADSRQNRFPRRPGLSEESCGIVHFVYDSEDEDESEAAAVDEAQGENAAGRTRAPTE